MKIAIIGTGISGLTAAHLLAGEHRLTLFEAADHVGGHTHTVTVEASGRRHAIDTGFIVFNELNYPNFCRLLAGLQVSSQPTSMGFSVRCDQTGLEYNGTSLNRLFAQRRNLFRPRFYRMLRDILRFGREARTTLSDAEESITVEDYIHGTGYDDWFYTKYLIPLGSALWSCPPEKFRHFPIRFVVEFLHNHAMLDTHGRPTWRVIQGGSANYLKPLTAAFEDRIRLSCPVTAIRRHDSHVEVKTGPGGTVEDFDEVIIACHADQALALLADSQPEEWELLSAFPYQANQAVLHTDTSVLPRRQRAWASWNYHLRSDRPDQSTVTYNMNMLQDLAAEEVYCVTLNDDDGIDPARVIRRFQYHHPTYTTGRRLAQSRHHELIRSRRTSFCGAYWGFGFHEDGVNSGLAVARAFGADLAT